MKRFTAAIVTIAKKLKKLKYYSKKNGQIVVQSYHEYYLLIRRNEPQIQAMT